MTRNKAARSAHSSERRALRRTHETARAKLAAERAGAALQSDGLLRLPEVLALIPVSASTWWEGCRTHRFPAPVRLGPRCTWWRAGDIRALLEQLDTDGTA